MNNKEEIMITDSYEETKAIGQKMAKKLKPGELIALYGNLGGGKTTFVQGLALGLGIKKRIISPTFIIIRVYDLKSKTFFHIDLYRTKTAEDIKGLGIKEIISDDNNIVVVEWAEKLKDLLPDKRIDIHFEYLGENKRKLKIIKNGL